MSQSMNFAAIGKLLERYEYEATWRDRLNADAEEDPTKQTNRSIRTDASDAKRNNMIKQRSRGRGRMGPGGRSLADQQSLLGAGQAFLNGKSLLGS